MIYLLCHSRILATEMVTSKTCSHVPVAPVVSRLLCVLEHQTRSLICENDSIHEGQAARNKEKPGKKTSEKTILVLKISLVLPSRFTFSSLSNETVILFLSACAGLSC